MTTTIKDFGRHSERFGDIGFYYAFPIKFWFGQSMLVPEDVLSWCRENCTGFYKVVSYTHERSQKADGLFTEKYIFVDKIYLEKEEDAALIKLTYDVRDQQVKRPKLKRIKKTRVKVKKLTAEDIAEASRKLAAQSAPAKTGAKRVKKVNAAQLTLV